MSRKGSFDLIPRPDYGLFFMDYGRSLLRDYLILLEEHLNCLDLSMME